MLKTAPSSAAPQGRRHSRLRRAHPPGAPAVAGNLYARDALEDPRTFFRKIRDAGPVVWLPRHRMYAMGRFAEVRAALRDGDTFVSGHGVAANAFTNTLGTKFIITTLFTDGELHDTQRRLMRQKLSAAALRDIKGHIERQAETTVRRLATGASFDVVNDFSSALPTNIVAELVGLRLTHREMLEWAASNFQALGPTNTRTTLAAPTALTRLWFAARLKRDQVVPGSWADSVFDARDRGEINTRQARGLIVDFVTPSLDTTILAATDLLWHLAKNPQAWDEVRNDPALASAAVIETVRLSSPIRGFTRKLARDHSVAGVKLPKGARVVMLYGAANLDERQFPDPERFDIHRPNAGLQLAWGNGGHACGGLHLAKMELEALIHAMIPLVERIEVFDPVRLRNNTLQGFSALSARFVPA